MKFIFKIVIHSLLLVVLATKLKAQSSTASTTPQKLVPGWVSKRPTSIKKYIGIGMY